MAEKKARPKTIISPVGIASYPHLNTPDTRFSDQAPKYKIKLRLDPNEQSTQDFIAALQPIYDAGLVEQKKENPKYATRMKPEFPLYAEEFDKEGNPTGMILFKVECKAEYKPKNSDKVVKIKPKLVDSKNKALADDVKVFGGSKVRVAFTPIPFAFSNTKYGLSLRLEAVQVIELSTGSGGSSPFDEVEGGFEAGDSEEFKDSPTSGEGSAEPEGDEEF